MRATCLLVTDLPHDNTHFLKTNRTNSRGTAHFGNHLYNHKALASHCNQPRNSPSSFTFRNVGRETVFSALHLYFGFLVDRLRALMPTLTTLLNRPLKVSELNYIGFAVKEPLSGEDDHGHKQLDGQEAASNNPDAPSA